MLADAVLIAKADTDMSKDPLCEDDASAVICADAFKSDSIDRDKAPDNTIVGISLKTIPLNRSPIE